MILVVICVEFREAEPAKFVLTSCTFHELATFSSDDHNIAVGTRLGVESHVKVAKGIGIVKVVEDSRIRICTLPLRLAFSTFQITLAVITFNEAYVLALRVGTAYKVTVSGHDLPSKLCIDFCKLLWSEYLSHI